MNQIIVEHKVKKRIAEELGTTYDSIRRALSCKRDTLLTRRIRERALELGGVEVVTKEV